MMIITCSLLPDPLSPHYRPGSFTFNVSPNPWFKPGSIKWGVYYNGGGLCGKLR